MTILSCTLGQKNIGVSACKKLPQLPAGVITTPMDWSVTPAEMDDLVTKFQDALLAEKRNRIYYWPDPFNVENISEEAVYQETSFGTRSPRDGRYKFKFFYTENLEMHKAMYSHKNYSGRAIVIDNEGKVFGTVLANGNFAGLSIDMLNVEKIVFNTGSEVSMTPMYLSILKNRELDVNGGQIDGSTFLNSLVRLTTVNLTVESATSTEIVAKVESSLDLVPVLGLTLADFVLLDSSGSAQSITTVTDNDDGTYTLGGTAFTSGTLNLVAASALSIKGYEAKEAAEVTIA